MIDNPDEPNPKDHPGYPRTLNLPACGNSHEVYGNN